MTGWIILCVGLAIWGARIWFSHWLGKKIDLAIKRLPIQQKPTLKWISPTEYYYVIEGVIYHNTEGPAIVRNGSAAWMVNGVPHRLEGPAKIGPNQEEYWLYGKQYTKKRFYKEVKRIKTKKWYSNYSQYL